VIVVDTSAVVEALVTPDAEPLRARLSGAGSLHCPHLVDSEVVHALRGLVHRNHLDIDRARDALSDFMSLAIVRYPATTLLGRMWELRDSLTAYDATFVALAETLECPLVTCDARLERARHTAEVELHA
jgi:predicted nucleic acid-binding protein